MRSADLVDDQLVPQDLVRVADEEDEELELGAGQLDGLLTDPDLATGQIDAQIAEREVRVGDDRRRTAVVSAGAP